PHVGASSFFFFNDPATTALYTLSLHDALPILRRLVPLGVRTLQLRLKDATDGEIRRQIAESLEITRRHGCQLIVNDYWAEAIALDRKSTRLNSSHVKISYAVFCLKKKKKTDNT